MVGEPRWSVTKRMFPFSCASRRMVFTAFPPCCPHTQEVRTTAQSGSISNSPASFDAP